MARGIRTFTAMTADTLVRDDLFTHIHKALRLGLFELTVQAGRTDWADPAEVAALGERWWPLLDLLRAHTEHEDRHILRILDDVDPQTTEPAGEQHRDLDDLLGDLDDRFIAVLAAPNPSAGLGLYRDLARFVASYLPHLHEEETVVMARVWELCGDEGIALTRARFMADTTPEVMATTLQYMLPALERPTRHALVARLAATAPPPVLQGLLQIGERVLDPAAFADVRAVAAATAAAAHG
ncbi:Hemerythrin domain-containing protein [Frankia sp. Hr75.2]|nr:Hemerythrin domain-containing protein [Frankia sp. Hr75.2]